MKSSHVLTFALALLESGCVRLEEIDADDISVEVCPDETCTLVADGTRALPLAVTIDAPVPHPELSVHLQLSAGAFAAPTDPVHPADTEVLLERGDRAAVTMIAPTTPGWLRIDTEVGGLHKEHWFRLRAADVDTVELSASPARLGDDTPLAVLVSAWPSSGQLSTGTTVALSLIEPDPDEAYAQIFPSSGRLNAGGELTATLHKDASLRSVTVEATVTPPSVEGIEPALSVARRFVLTAPALTGLGR
jgi:hypothetical protein